MGKVNKNKFVMAGLLSEIEGENEPKIQEIVVLGFGAFLASVWVNTPSRPTNLCTYCTLINELFLLSCF